MPYSGVSWQQQMHVRMEPSPILPEWSSIELLLCIHGAWVDELFRWCGDVAWRMIVRIYVSYQISYHNRCDFDAERGLRHDNESENSAGLLC